MARSVALALAPAALLACLLCSPNPARANVVWRGDFETGDLSQWSKSQIVSADRMQVVASPVAQGSRAVRVLVKKGDNPIGASGNRNELLYLSYEPQGSERWYRWQTMWDPSYPSVATWQLFTQWHHSGDGGSPPLEFYVYAEEVRLRVNASTIVWTAPLQRGVWHDFVMHAKWSPDASEGFLELWYDGALALPKRFVQNQFAGETNYLKQGLYRSDTVDEDGIVFHDGFTIGETEADVRGPTPVSPDAGAKPLAGPDAAGSEPVGPDAGAPPPPAPGPDAAASEPDAAPRAAPDASPVGIPPADAALTGSIVPADASGTLPDAGGDPVVPAPAPEPATGCTTAGGELMVPALAMIVVGVLLLMRRRKD
ncbi:MAG TPA: polysaccharide lyase [Myxococcales bacterium]|jgi:hypothetical protein